MEGQQGQSVAGSTSLPVLQPVASTDGENGSSSLSADVDAAGKKALAEMEERVAAKWVFKLSEMRVPHLRKSRKRRVEGESESRKTKWRLMGLALFTQGQRSTEQGDRVARARSTTRRR